MRTLKKFYVAAASLVVAVGALVALNVTGTTGQAISSFRNCNPDAIIECGALSQAELLQKYDQNVGDVKHVYSHYGIARSDIAGTSSEVKVGTVYRDGRVVVDGKTVATGAYSLSRVKYTSQGQPRTVVINGTTYYEGPSMAIFTGAVDAFVMFRNGQFYKAVLSSCGNPLVAVPEKPEPQPEYACKNLTATKIDRTRYRFNTTATAVNGAEIVSYNYSFGDGNTTTGGATVDHTYARPGTYNVTVTVNVRVNGQIKVVPGANCNTTVTVEEKPQEPVYRCESLNATKINRTSFTFTSAATAVNGAEIVSYNYDFGDGNKTTGGATVEHTYARPGTYNATMTVNVRVNGVVKVVPGVNCKTTVTVEEAPKKPVYACKSLEADKINRTTHRFNTEAIAENGAKIVKYTYNFGDGSKSATTKSSVTHEYDQPGNYTITVNVTFLVNGKEVTPKSPYCKTTVTVKEAPAKPVYKCESLTARPITTKERTYAYTLTYAAEGGAELDRVVINFGDNVSKTFLPADVANIEHTFAQAGSYTSVATLYFNVPSSGETVERRDTCEVKITIEKPEMCPVPGKEHLPKDSPECYENCPIPGKEHLPKDSPECVEPPCEIPGKEHLPKDSPECVDTPPELPKTGLDLMIGGGLGLGSLSAAVYYYGSSRRNLNALLNK